MFEVIVLKNIDIEKKENFDNMKVGFLLELLFRQKQVNNNLRDISSFIKENEDFFNSLDLCCIYQAIDYLCGFIYNFIDICYKDVDSDENYCKYYKDFY